MADKLLVKKTLRVNLDDNTVNIVTPNPWQATRTLVTDGVWVTDKLWYPPHRIVSVEVAD